LGFDGSSPQWKPWVKDLTARCKYEGSIMSETIMVFNGTASWKKPGEYNPDHMGEDGDWQILTKDNKILLFYYYANDELTTRLMRKTFTVPKAKPAAKKPKAKPKAKAPAKKPVAKPRAKAKPKPRTKTTSKARPSPSQSAAATKVGTRKRGNDGFMWEVKQNKNGVHRWARDTKSTKRAEDYWYWKV